jgi:hypothetical protein
MRCLLQLQLQYVSERVRERRRRNQISGGSDSDSVRLKRSRLFTANAFVSNLSLSLSVSLCSTYKHTAEPHPPAGSSETAQTPSMSRPAANLTTRPLFGGAVIMDLPNEYIDARWVRFEGPTVLGTRQRASV